MPMLEAAPGIRAIAIFEELCRRHPRAGPSAGGAGRWRSRLFFRIELTEQRPDLERAGPLRA